MHNLKLNMFKRLLCLISKRLSNSVGRGESSSAPTKRGSTKSDTHAERVGSSFDTGA